MDLNLNEFRAIIKNLLDKVWELNSEGEVDKESNDLLLKTEDHIIKHEIKHEVLQ